MTVDLLSLTDGAATIRERDTTNQCRVAIDKIPDVVASLSTGVRKWADVVAEYGLVETSKAEE